MISNECSGKIYRMRERLPSRCERKRRFSRRVGVASHTFTQGADACFIRPAPAAQNLGMDLRRPCKDRRVAACLKRWRALPLRSTPREWPAIFL